MNWKSPIWMMALVLSLFAGNCKADEIVDSSTGIKFPEKVTIDYQGKQYNLIGTGAATRKKFFVKVYSVASYVENPADLKTGDLFKNIIDSKQAKQLSLTFVRDVPQKKIVGGFKESFEKVPYTNQGPIDKFLSFFGNVQSGDTQTFRWLPDGTVVIIINGHEKGSIKNTEFARALWSVWFGNTGVVDKSQLVSKIKK